MDPKKCSICHENLIKYTCPRCARRTCSLSCCLQHKKTFQCNGQREKTSFKPLDAMNDLDLLSDYRFLEEVHRQVEGCQRDDLSNEKRSFNESTRFQKFLQGKLKSLGSIQILYLPRLSTRHKQNQMWFEKKRNEIFWHIECRFFLQAFQSWTITRLPTKDVTLSNLLTKYQEFSQTTDFTDVNRVCVYIENFGQKRKQYGQYEQRPFQTIVDLLRERVFIEYPILFITLIDHENQMKDFLLNKSN